MGIAYTNLFHSKALQNLLNVGFPGLKIYIPSGNPAVKNGQFLNCEVSENCCRGNCQLKHIFPLLHKVGADVIIFKKI
jgi:hypothetical protein